MKFIRALFILFCVAFSATAEAAPGDLVATISVTGAPAGVTYTLTDNPNGYFVIQNGNQLVQAINTPPGTYSVGIQATAPGFSASHEFVINYAPIPPPPFIPGFAVGMNLSGLESEFPLATSSAEISYYTARGFTRIRLPVGWSQSNPNCGVIGFQPVAFGPLDTTNTCWAGGYVGLVDTVIAAINGAGGSTLLDVHTFGNGPGGFPIGSADLPCSAFADLWSKLSTHYKGMAGVRGYDLMNEPVNGFSFPDWFACAQAAINAIRANNDTTPIYVEGVNYSGAWNWVSGESQPYNNSTIYTIFDPLNRMVFSAHGYLDNDSSGSNFSWALETAKPGVSPPGVPTSATIGVTRETPFATWAQSHTVSLHHGEIGASNDALAAGGNDNYTAWNTALGNTIAFAQAHNYEIDIWGAGPNFNPNYPPYPGPSSVSNPSVPDFTSAGLQSTLMVLLEQYTGYSGPQPTAYRVDLPVTVTPTANPEASIVTSVPYGSNGVASGNFTIRYNGKLTSTVTITPHDFLSDGTTSAAGTFTPATITLPAGNNALATFTYTPSQEATIRISTTNNGGWTDPPALGFSSIPDVYSTLTKTPTNVYGMYRRYTPYIGPALLLKRATDGAQLAFSYNNIGNLPRADIQTWASSNVIPVVTVYDQSPLGNDLAFTGQLCNLQLDNSAHYPEVECLAGTTGNFNTPVNGQTAVTAIVQMSQTGGGSIFRQDQFLGPIIFGQTNFQIINTGFVGSTTVWPGADTVGNISTGIVNGSYHEYAGTYTSGATNGVKTYVDGSLNAQATPNSTIGASFTLTQSGTNATVSSVLGTIIIGDTLAGAGVAGGTTIVSQTSGPTGGSGVYVTSLSGTASGVAGTTSGTHYTLNAAFGSQSTQFAFFRFGSANWGGNWYNVELEQGLALTSGQIAAVAAADATYYSTPLPDTLPAANPTIGGTVANQAIYPGLYSSFPFQAVTIADTNTGSPTDSVTITLAGDSGTLSGTGISGSGPYTIASASAASVTATLQGASFTTANTIGHTTTFTIAVTSSAGSSASNGTTSTIVTTYTAETAFSVPAGTFTPMNLFGVNLDGGENTGVPPTGLLPQNFELDYFAGKGFGLIRLPITSQFAQTTAFGLLSPTYMAAIKDVIDHAFAVNMYVVIDPHDFGTVWNSVAGARQTIIPNTLTQALFEDEWNRLSKLFKNYPNVIFGLQNEPVGMTVAQWFTSASTVIPFIRANGANQLITIPGGATFTGAHDWVSSGNGAAWAGFAGDTANNFIFEMHQYLDSDNSGGSPVAVVGYGSTSLVAATAWLSSNSFQAFLGEFGVGWDPWFPINLTVFGGIDNYDPAHGITLTTHSITENTAMLAYMQAHSAQWTSWAEWAGGRNFSAPPQAGGYVFNPEPARPYPTPIVDQPQMPVLVGALGLGSLLLSDGTSFLLQTDGTSKITL